MKDLRSILIKALVAKLKTETSIGVYTRMPKGAEITYPYVWIGDIYDKEIGPKTSFMYEYDVQVMTVYKDLNDLAPLFATLDKVKGVINNAVPFTLDNPYKILSCELGASSTTDFDTETGTESVGIVRMIFKIE